MNLKEATFNYSDAKYITKKDIYVYTFYSESLITIYILYYKRACRYITKDFKLSHGKLTTYTPISRYIVTVAIDDKHRSAIRWTWLNRRWIFRLIKYICTYMLHPMGSPIFGYEKWTDNSVEYINGSMSASRSVPIFS